MKYKNLLIHQLALAGILKSTDELKEIADQAAGLGASGLELLYQPELPPTEAAKIMLERGLTTASLCMAHTDPKADPLSPDPESWSKAARLVSDAIFRVTLLRQAGLKINILDGPLCFLLGKQDYPAGTYRGMIDFMRPLAEKAEKEGVLLAIEMLQHSEDGAIKTTERLGSLVREIGSPACGQHLDSFHIEKNEEDTVSAIAQAGKKLFHFHANGIGIDSAELEGRIPCGCRDFNIDDEQFMDRISWRKVATALHRNPNFNDLLICLEPFSAKACEDIPPLKTGVVPVSDLSQIAESIRNLAYEKILVLA